MLRLLMICTLGLASIGAARQMRACYTYDHAAEMELIDAALASDRINSETRARLGALRDAMAANEGNFFAHHNATVKALALLGTYRIRMELPAAA